MDIVALRGKTIIKLTTKYGWEPVRKTKTTTTHEDISFRKEFATSS